MTHDISIRIETKVTQGWLRKKYGVIALGRSPIQYRRDARSGRWMVQKAGWYMEEGPYLQCSGSTPFPIPAIVEHQHLTTSKPWRISDSGDCEKKVMGLEKKGVSWFVASVKRASNIVHDNEMPITRQLDSFMFRKMWHEQGYGNDLWTFHLHSYAFHASERL